MPRTSTRSPVADALSEAIKDIGPDDIDSEWLDKMVKRLFKELQKQLARVEATKPDDNDTKTASVRTANVRTLDAIERTLERLTRLENERISRRQMKTVVRNDELRAQLQRKIDNLLTYQGPSDSSEETDA
jgi:leucyl-tRNA synthetase